VDLGVLPGIDLERVPLREAPGDRMEDHGLIEAET
jgi:hypothetical protein